MHYVPCGKCIGCLKKRRKDWTTRCIHEARKYEENCFVTLTYNESYLPETFDMVKRDVQLFIKRLRKKGYKFRYYGCGESGDRFGRKHAHLVIFGQDFTSDRDWETTERLF